MAEEKNKQLFLSLIYSFQMQGMMQLGKLSNPMTNKSERELDGAQVTIDMLDMMKEKTKNNIGDDESRFLSQVIADLKLNYVEERDKDQKADLKVEEKKEEAKETSEQPEEKKEDSSKEEPKKAESKKGPGKHETGTEKPLKESAKKEPEADSVNQGESNSKDDSGK
ncbi:MAG: DUF1844 domain-containing protein [Ignavibacteria bacterium]